MIDTAYLNDACTLKELPTQSGRKPTALLLSEMGLVDFLKRMCQPTRDTFTVRAYFARPLLAAIIATSTLMIATGATRAAFIAPNLTAYFPLDDGPVSSTASNAVSGGNTGTLVGSMSTSGWQSDTPPLATHSTGSLNFPGGVGATGVDILGSSPTDYLDISQPFTVSTWYRLDTGAFANDFPSITSLTTNSASNESWDLTINNGSGFGGVYSGINFGSSSDWGRFRTNFTPATAAALADNTWHHLLVTYDGVDITAQSSFALYLDGVSQSLTGSGAFGLRTDAYIGTLIASTSVNFLGNIDDFAVFSEQLSAEEISFLAAGGSPLFPVPEPSTFLLLGIGAFGLMRHTRRRRRKV